MSVLKITSHSTEWL